MTYEDEPCFRQLMPPLRNDGTLLGYGPMDDLHAEYVCAIDDLLKAPDDRVAAALAELERQTRVHFEAEERWMDETDFPARGCHTDEHAAVLRSVVGVAESVAGGEFEAARALAAALFEWFPSHADYMDAALAHWICNLRLGGKPVVVHRRAAVRSAPDD